MNEEREKPRPGAAQNGRLRRESRPETSVGAMIAKAAEEAENRTVRQRGYPEPTTEEAAVIAASAHEPVRLFTRVLIANLDDGDLERFTLVPHDEADIAAGKISIGSPLGRALYQEYPGAGVTVKTPGGPVRYRVLQVEV